ncbi:MAG: hypothetical protein KAT68_11570 [Bacteroidales bacterium]|nr:hypothetical protein [Bacteroidales bacterium]
MYKNNILLYNLDIKKLIPLLIDYINFLKNKLIELDGIELNYYQRFLIYHIERFRIITESLISILNLMQNDIRHKLSLSLLLRSVNSDFLTILYLSTFYNTNKDNQIAINNEINIFLKDYIKFIEKINIEEPEVKKHFHNISEVFIKNQEYVLNNLHTEYKNLYKHKNGEFKLKSNFEIRESTPDSFFVNNDRKEKITEKYKFERLKKYGKEKFGMAYIIFKYYSQFQHVSPMDNRLLRNNPQIIDYKLLIQSIENLFIATNLGLKMGTPKHDGSEIEINNFHEQLLHLD